MMENTSPAIERNHWTEAEYAKIGVVDLHKTLEDLYCARYYGFLQYRLPTPGRKISKKTAEDHIAKVQHEWIKEMSHRNSSGVYSEPDFESLPLQAKIAYHEVITDQKEERHGFVQLDLPEM